MSNFLKRLQFNENIGVFSTQLPLQYHSQHLESMMSLDTILLTLMEHAVTFVVAGEELVSPSPLAHTAWISRQDWEMNIRNIQDIWIASANASLSEESLYMSASQIAIWTILKNTSWVTTTHIQLCLMGNDRLSSILTSGFKRIQVEVQTSDRYGVLPGILSYYDLS